MGNIEVWAKNKGHSISRTLLYNNKVLPDVNDFDWLVIMGGSMNIYEEDRLVSHILTNEARNSSIFGSLPGIFSAFQWHSDTFKNGKCE